MRVAHFNDTYLQVCSWVDEHSRLDEAFSDAQVCQERLVNIKKVADRAYDESLNMTMLTFTDEFCDAIAAPLPAPDAQMVEHIKKVAKRQNHQMNSVRELVTGVFLLAQGHRHEIVNSHGVLLENKKTKNEDYATITEEAYKHVKNALDDPATFGCSGHVREMCADLNAAGTSVQGKICKVKCGTSSWPVEDLFSLRPLSYECDLPDPVGTQCYQKVIENSDNGDIAQTKDSERLRAACTGHARISSFGGGFSVGPIEVGVSHGTGYGIFQDSDVAPEYKVPSGGSDKVKFAEQEFFELCVGINLAATIPKQLDDLASFGLEFSTGQFREVGALPFSVHKHI